MTQTPAEGGDSLQLDIVDLDPPFHWEINQHAGMAHQRSIAWLRRFRIITDDDAAAAHLAENWGIWAGVSWPIAGANGLQLGADLPSLWTVLDNELSGTADNTELLDALRAAVMCPGKADELAAEVPLAAALADLWSRQRCAASAVSQALAERSASCWLEWIDASAVEAESQRYDGPQTCDISAYDTLRDIAGVMQVIYTFDEAIGGYEIPEPGIHLTVDTPLGRMRRATTRYIDYLNDLTSLPKEEASGETLNGVLVLQKQRACTRGEAIAEVRRMIRAYTDAFLAEEASLPAYCDACGLDTAQRRALYRTVAGMRNLASAVYMISVHSSRWALPPVGTT
jgi:hypothetical protein